MREFLRFVQNWAAFARCSTNETRQDIHRQVRELKAAGAEEIYLEYEHGDSKVKSQQQAMIRSRVRSGMANAKAKGKQIGRPQIGKEDIPAAFLRHYPAYKNGQLNVSELARVCDLSRTTVYKYIGLLEK